MTGKGASGRTVRTDRHGWRQEKTDLLRGIAAGAIVGVPLLYTIEMWWHGITLSEWHLLAFLGAILFVNFLFSLLSGFRNEYSVPEAFSETLASVAIGALFSAAILWLVGEITPHCSLRETLGKIVIGSGAVSIGVSFANAQVRRRSRTGDDETGRGDEGSGDPVRRQLEADLKEAAAALAGATVFSMNVAPTEEIVLIALRLAPWRQLAVLAATIALCYVILFAAGFKRHRVHLENVFQHPVTETVIVCAISLATAFALLTLLGQREVMSHPSTAVAATITLGLPATVGGAAGRLIA